MQQEMADRIAAAMRERGEPLDAEAIARDFLKLTNAAAPPTCALVRAILSRDRRFEELSEGSWSLSSCMPALQPPVAICALEIPNGAARAPWLWRIWATLWAGEGDILSHQGAVRTGDLEKLFTWLRAHPTASDRPGLLAQWIGAQERIHALPESTPLVIDLRAWQRLLGVDEANCIPKTSTGHSLETSGESPGTSLLQPLCKMLDRVVAAAETRNLRSWRDAALVPARAREKARQRVSEIWNRKWTFTPEDVASLAEEPGVYRFMAAEGKLLYIGKAKNLRQRVASYFRPLEDDSSRRAVFLRQLRRLEVETTGTELEALIRESRLIQDHRPPWNVQVNIGTEEAEFPAGEEELLLLLPRVQGSFTLFVLGGPRAALMHLDPSLDAEALREALCCFYVEGNASAGLEEIPAPERALVRRWLRWSREGCVVFRLMDFSSHAAAASAVHQVVGGADGSPAKSVPLIVREG